MTGRPALLLLLQLAWLASGTWAQRSSFSLQAAVDELHRREAAKYPLNAPPAQQHYFGGLLGAGGGEQDYWDDDTEFPANNNNNNNKNRNRQRLNKALAKYLGRENYEADHGGLSLGPFGGYEFDGDSNNFLQNYPDEKKRSSYFRERDGKYDNVPASVFRERETPVATAGDHAELTDEFLREIEETQEHEREERYKEALRHLWEKYQQQENDITGDLFEEKKRLRTPPYYMLMQKKRSAYPVLPWLPYAEHKKRFPVAKRSTKRLPGDSVNLGKTDEKVVRELSELFGNSAEEKKKRSTDEQVKGSSTHAPDHASSTVGEMRLELPVGAGDKENNTEAAAQTAGDPAGVKDGDHEHHQHDHDHKEHSGHKDHNHSDQHSHDSHEEEEESESDEHDGHEDQESEEHDFEEEEEEEERKKKRDVEANKLREPIVMTGAFKLLKDELFRDDELPQPRELTSNRRKKSIDWSKYFGIDRKKKAFKADKNLDVKKRSTIKDDGDDEEPDKMKRELDAEKLDNMDKKLQSIEEFIIDETIKYTGAHEGIASPDEIRRLKEHVLSRLATAYSLEKMRRALEKLRQSVDNENHLLRNVIEAESRSEEDDSIEHQKRLSVKKETPSLVHDHAHALAGHDKVKEVHSNAMMSSATTADAHIKNADPDADGEDEAIKKHKKKRNGYLRYPELPNDFADFEQELGAGHYETLNDAYLGNKNYIVGSNQCPLIESMAERCRGVDLLSGDINQELLPICGVHQICYLCGTSQVACDYQYLAEADSICGNNNDCQAAAHSVLMILRGTPGPQLGPKECLKNSCLYSAMREIGL